MTHPIGYLFLAGAVASIAAAFLFHVEFVLLSIACSFVAAFFERDYPSGF